MARSSITLRTKSDKANAVQRIAEAAFGSRVEIKGVRRTSAQNRKLHAMIDDVSEQVWWYGQKLDIIDWKTIFGAALKKSRVVPGLDEGSFVVLGLRTSDLSIAETADLITLVDAFGAEHRVKFGGPDDAEAA